jgi:hypothetical protein
VRGRRRLSEVPQAATRIGIACVPRRTPAETPLILAASPEIMPVLRMPQNVRGLARWRPSPVTAPCSPSAHLF